ncbi:TetR/AcrR family transcriptional regulator [Streptomyces sp. NPDC002463]|uniref:TetR/AcrR family transcriptional regulator n=1 Tax=Streptomyces sp. NPDC002463 TaxID=3364645 RepID=UPI0036BF420B
MRSDARSNRLRILEAATELLASPGAPTLQSIARRAGVGQGTLYRHFPTREALVLQVYGEEVEGLVSAVPVLLDALPPERALRAWLERLLNIGRGMPGFADAVDAATSLAPGLRGEAYGPLLDALSALVSANEAAGTIAPGTTADDVLLLLKPLWQVLAHSEDRSPEHQLFETVTRTLWPGQHDAVSRSRLPRRG